MLWKLILLLTAVPLLELYVLVRLAAWRGFFVTVLVIFATGAIGAVLARMQGLLVIGKIQSELSQGKLPADSVLEGVMVLVAAALLVTPGILTDSAGFILLVPAGRRLVIQVVKSWLKKKMEQGRVQVYKDMGFGPINEEPPPDAPPIENNDDQC